MTVQQPINIDKVLKADRWVTYLKRNLTHRVMGFLYPFMVMIKEGSTC